MAKDEESRKHDAETAKRLGWIGKAAKTPKSGSGSRAAKNTSKGRKRDK